MKLCKNFIQVALILHGFTLHVPHITVDLCFTQINSPYVMHYMCSSLYMVKKCFLFLTVMCFTSQEFQLYTIYLEKNLIK